MRCAYSLYLVCPTLEDFAFRRDKHSAIVSARGRWYTSLCDLCLFHLLQGKGVGAEGQGSRTKKAAVYVKRDA